MDELDYLVLGGGSAGCAVASRLSEDAGVTVGLLEAGGSGDSWIVNTPLAGVLMIPTGINNWAFATVPQRGLNGRRGYQPRGRTLGGSSALNAMVYTRGHPADYDDWAALGNRGWSFAEVLTYFKRSECNEDFGGEWHGRDGPLTVSRLRTDNAFHTIFLQAAREAGFPLREDFNGAEQEGLGLYQVTQKDGERCSAARAYIHPHLGKRPNLRLECRARVVRILIEGKRAVGAEYRQDGRRKILRARREVILSAGAFQSPQILMLSGIGDGNELRKFGIEPIAHLPGVGRNLQDHPDFIFAYRASSRDLLGLSATGLLRLLRELHRYLRERRGMLATNFAEAGGFLKTRPDLAIPDIQLHFVVALVEDHARRLRAGHGFSCHVCLLRPKSRGTVTLASADPFAAPLIDPNFLEHPDDLEGMVSGFKVTRRLLDAPALASLRRRDLFTADVRDDDDIRAVLRQRVDTVYHPVGTCRMGVDDAAVVDPTLKLRGVVGLRVVDASVMPTLIGGNTNAPCIMIGEKAADLIRAEARSG